MRYAWPALLVGVLLVPAAAAALADTPCAITMAPCPPPVSLYHRNPSPPLVWGQAVPFAAPTIHQMEIAQPTYREGQPGPSVTLVRVAPPPCLPVYRLVPPEVTLCQQPMTPPAWILGPKEPTLGVCEMLPTQPACGPSLRMPSVTLCRQPQPLPPTCEAPCPPQNGGGARVP
jgi:hypothetical protein